MNRFDIEIYPANPGGYSLNIWAERKKDLIIIKKSLLKLKMFKREEEKK